VILYLVNRYFWPDESATSLLLTDLAEDLQAAGHRVEVFTSRQLYGRPRAKLPRQEQWQGVRIHRLPASCFGRGRFWGRLADIITFHLALRYAGNITRGPDAWFVMTDPPLLVNTVLSLKRRFGGRVVHHVDDLYPDLAVALGSLPSWKPLVDFWDRRVKAGLLNCDQVLALGECMAEVLKRKGVRPEQLMVTPPWADGRQLAPLPHDDNRFRRELGLGPEDVAVMYSGNMGQGHRFETILAAARSLADDEHLRFVFIGAGARRAQIDAFRQAHQLKNIMMLPYQPRERLRETLSAGDIHLISLEDRVQGLIVPSKLAGILAVGRPALLVGDEANSIAGALQRGGCGYVIPEGRVAELRKIIRELADNPETRRRLGQAGRRLFEAEYDRAVVVPKIRAILEGGAG
jgi:colanic acid biosynthesis glycosyl transferase WcaI